MARMSFTDALGLVDDDLPDGAYFAMAYDMAGLEYGNGFGDLSVNNMPLTGRGSGKKHRPHVCEYCRKPFRTDRALGDHRRDVHAKRMAREGRT
jgi:hypothetical protein